MDEPQPSYTLKATAPNGATFESAGIPAHVLEAFTRWLELARIVPRSAQEGNTDGRS